MSETLQGQMQEVFISIQGEGPWMGFRQLFIRLAGCQYHCNYCDTPQAQKTAVFWRWHTMELKHRVLRQKNPVEPDKIVNQLLPWIKKHQPLHSIAITGGEPMEQAPFTTALALAFKRKMPGIKLLLETNGLALDDPRIIASWCDYLSLDIKLASATGQPTDWRHYQKLLSAIGKLDGCVKCVFSPDKSWPDIRRSAKLIHDFCPEWELILQPVASQHMKASSNAQMDMILTQTMKIHPKTRLLFQMHRLAGIA